MNILLVSQCRKNALTETRRILDQFAERCGDCVWQTAITQAGLETLYKMLRQTARKNTAVACYWTHGKNRTELLWIVGDKRQFNEQGRVPTNRTQRNILRVEDEVNWKDAYSIQILTALAALLHDLGKSSVGFQNKLIKTKNAPKKADPYRHEWISARLFEAMITGCETDQDWLKRLADWAKFEEQNPHWHENIIEDDMGKDFSGFGHLPPIAQVLIWLITSHHRLPFSENFFVGGRNYLRDLRGCCKRDFQSFFSYYRPIERWVFNDSQHPKPQHFWQFDTIVTQSRAWQKAMTRWTRKALNHPALFSSSYIENPFALLLARLSLVAGDHYYSSQARNTDLGDKKCTLLANTDDEGNEKQRLDEHLLGVCQSASRFARLLPKFSTELPHIKQHKPFAKPATSRFAWQNNVVNLAKKIQKNSETQGFFGVNMASTGCGKTFANAKMMYALSDPAKGARLTIALGLRVLTLQTGTALSQRLELQNAKEQDYLAVLVGSSAVRKLYELQQERAQQLAEQGSESIEQWFENMTVAGATYIESAVENEEISDFLTKKDPTMKKLLYAPLVSCTLDHIIAASESVRGGHHIVPTLRLLTSDLILDEPDDFGLEDLPALSRLVHLAGLFGSRVLLSSATLTPDFITGLFRAYQAGRQIYNQQQGIVAELPVCCAWVDEFQQQQMDCGNEQIFMQQHQQFVLQRAENLAKSPVRRKAEILTLPSLSPNENEMFNYRLLAEHLLKSAAKLHSFHGEMDSKSQKKVSIGLVRFSNITPMIPIAQALLQQQAHDELSDYCFHLCCYHSRQLLLLRSNLEEKLDRLLDRHDPQDIYQQPEIISALASDPAKNHVFIVLGSPVTEVGRDHDYDWAIVDPSSMRSIIQLAGRVWRHRADKVAEQPNMYLLPTNWRGLSLKQKSNKPIYHRPGFESETDKLSSYKLAQLISAAELSHIQATPRIVKPANLQPRERLADLEHQVIANLLNNPRENHVNLYWDPRYTNRLLANLPLMTRFRQSLPEQDIVCKFDDDSDWGFSFYDMENVKRDNLSTSSNFEYKPLPDCPQSIVKPWLNQSLEAALAKLAEDLELDDVKAVPVTYLSVSIPLYNLEWDYNEMLGFWDTNKTLM
ncbi:type I-F CRISPR-associated helicase Cas3f [Pasteurella canis]|uniref:type I-F CRISPR-associated helicase Cas3f n=1 Tax=Pasteurella canis TaxID=753 RepID=UPI001E390946|nr:type I-F CRISPR-associated helicase Cas3f [Pasteurella canis]UEA16276.1 type I-F CRISPR-associated helicase Cas3f [Pasteurella canis]